MHLSVHLSSSVLSLSTKKVVEVGSGVLRLRVAGGCIRGGELLGKVIVSDWTTRPPIQQISELPNTKACKSLT